MNIYLLLYFHVYVLPYKSCQNVCIRKKSQPLQTQQPHGYRENRSCTNTDLHTNIHIKPTADLDQYMCLKCSFIGVKICSGDSTEASTGEMLLFIISLLPFKKSSTTLVLDRLTSLCHCCSQSLYLILHYALCN